MNEDYLWNNRVHLKIERINLYVFKNHCKKIMKF